MSSSQNKKKDIILSVYKSDRTVFRLNDIAILTGISDFQSLNRRLNYYVRTDKLQNPRKGIYAKPGYSPEELACSIFPPLIYPWIMFCKKQELFFNTIRGLPRSAICGTV